MRNKKETIIEVVQDERSVSLITTIGAKRETMEFESLNSAQAHLNGRLTNDCIYMTVSMAVAIPGLAEGIFLLAQRASGIDTAAPGVVAIAAGLAGAALTARYFRRGSLIEKELHRVDELVGHTISGRPLYKNISSDITLRVI